MANPPPLQHHSLRDRETSVLVKNRDMTLKKGISMRYLKVSCSCKAFMVEVQRKHHGKSAGGFTVRTAYTAKRVQHSEHGLETLHCGHIHAHTLKYQHTVCWQPHKKVVATRLEIAHCTHAHTRTHMYMLHSEQYAGGY